MSFVLELHFDSPSEKVVKSLMQQLKEMGLPSNLLEKSVAPHLTLLSSETMLHQDSLEKLDKWLEAQPSFSLTALSLSTFANQEGVLFLGILVNQSLLNLHKSVYDCVSQSHYSLNSYYVPGRWVPRITLATKYSKEQLAQAVKELELTLPLELRVASLELVKYPAPLKSLKTWLFSGANWFKIYLHFVN